MPGKKALKAAELRGVCDPRVFAFKTTAELAPLDEVIGQERAVRAVEFGLNMQSRGYNIFVTGLEGTGKRTIIGDLVTAHARRQPSPSDWCLVHNFRDEFRPRTLAVPAGRGTVLAKRMARLVEELKKELPKALKSDAGLQRLDRVKKRFGDRQERLLKKIQDFAAERGLALDTAEGEFRLVPLLDGAPMAAEDEQRLNATQRAGIEKAVAETREQIEQVGREIDRLNQGLHAELEKQLNAIALSAVKWRVDRIREEFKSCAAVLEYLDTVERDIVENFNLFIPDDDGGQRPPEDWLAAQKASLRQYQVNVLVESGGGGAPVVVEPNPTYLNLIGRIEKRAYMGTVNTDFTMVQAGSLLSANGGYLVMELEPLLAAPYAWEALKRALQTGRLAIEDIAEEGGFGATALRPEPIPLQVKVVLLGSYEAFENLQNSDSRFNKLFKVRADFDDEVERTPDTVQLYARFVARVCREERLLPFTPTGVAAIVEYGQKYVENQNKLSLRFGTLLGVLKEADYWARRHGARKVTEKYVAMAFREHRFRYNLYEQKMHEYYKDNTIMIDVAGAVAGQINGLAIYQVGDFVFGRPVRITAETFMGKPGVINIEREADMSGATHNKGVLILSGYLGRTFAQQHPLNLSISIAFEQSYSDIDGDSASAAELFAVLSSLADIPLAQGIAVTGSVNQKGQIQAIGGVNQKIEGFFEVCREKGLDGRQGVVIPQANLKNLMLRREVLRAVRQRRFHVWAVASVAEGIEILTGRRAGVADRRGAYPEGTVFGAVQRKLADFAQRSARLARGQLAGDAGGQTAPPA